jgi:hypothetical protein
MFNLWCYPTCFVLLCILCLSVVNRICIYHAFSADYSLATTTTAPELARGDTFPHNRRTCAISVASGEPAAIQNVNSADDSRPSACHFGGKIATNAIVAIIMIST